MRIYKERSDVNMTTIMNCTPHAITMMAEGVRKTYEPSRSVARVSSVSVPVGMLDGFPVSKQEFGEITCLPEPVKGTVYLVSAVVLAALNESRPDCVAPDTARAIRDEQGRIIGVPGFVR